MAHKSKKKHIKHLHQHEQPAPNAGGSPSNDRPDASRRARLTNKARDAARAAKDIAQTTRARVRATAAAKRGEPANSNADVKRAPSARGGAAGKSHSKRGIVRTIASAATRKLADAATAKPKRMLSRAKARVRSLLHRDAV